MATDAAYGGFTAITTDTTNVGMLGEFLEVRAIDNYLQLITAYLNVYLANTP